MNFGDEDGYGDGIEEENPFTLPKEDIFMLREKEKREKLVEKERLQQLKIWEKNPQRSTHLVKSSRLNHNQKYQAPHQDRMFQGRRREKENMTDFIAKKRDMFLIQMSLDTKRCEIQNLEEKAKMKEEALRKSEQMLEEDAMRFDAFLKENDSKAHKALKKADERTKEKQEKVIEIKKLNQEISKVDSEMQKYDDNLKRCLEYKQFLDDLTPPEHIAAVKERKEKRKQEKLQEKIDEGYDVTIDDISSDEDEDEMYFKDPDQLLDIFAQLEERNLFLIQNVQETEEALEELRQKFADTQTTMQEKTTKLKCSIEELQSNIDLENEKAEQLTKTTQANTISDHQKRLLKGLSDKVKEVYGKCGFDADTQNDTLDMLREIEGKLELLLDEIHKLRERDPQAVAEAEKKRESERRNRVREAKKREQKRLYEERLAKSTARARAKVIRQTGKQVMFRSKPIREKIKKEEKNKNEDEEAEDVKKFFT